MCLKDVENILNRHLMRAEQRNASTQALESVFVDNIKSQKRSGF